MYVITFENAFFLFVVIMIYNNQTRYIIQNTKDKNYQKFIKKIHNAVLSNISILLILSLAFFIFRSKGRIQLFHVAKQPTWHPGPMAARHPAPHVAP